MSQEKSVSRRNFLKKSAALGAAVSLPALLAACGDNTPTATVSTTNAATTAAGATTATAATTAAGTTTTAAATTAAGGGVTTSSATSAVKGEVLMWDQFVTQGPSIDKALAAFQQAHPGLTVKRTVQAEDKYYDLLNLAQKGGNLPDVFVVIDGKSVTLHDMVDGGWVYDLTQFPDWNDFKKTFPEPDLNFYEGAGNTINGKTYSAPFNGTAGGMWYQLWVNTKVFKDAGIVDAQGNAKLPETADDVLNAAQQIKQKSGGKVYGWGFGGKDDTPWMLESLVGQLSGVYGWDGWNHKTGQFTYSTNPVYKQVAEFLLKLRDGNHILPDSGSVSDEAIRVMFAQNKFGMMINGTWIVPGWDKTNPGFNDYSITHVPFLGGAAQPKSFFLSNRRGGDMYYINAKSKNLPAAWELFKYIYSVPFAEEWIKGGNGDSVFPAANKPELFDAKPGLKNFYLISPKYQKLAPDPAVKNQDWGKVKVPAVNPTFGNILQGLYTGQVQFSDLDKTFKDMDDARTKAYTQAIQDAVTAGAKVSLADYTFPDWDPMQDYVNKPSK